MKMLKIFMKEPIKTFIAILIMFLPLIWSPAKEYFMIILCLLIIFLPTFLVYYFHLHLLEKSFKIEIKKDFINNPMNYPLCCLWLWSSLLMACSLIVWVFYITGDKWQITPIALNQFPLLSVALFCWVIITLILRSLSKSKKFLLLAGIGISLVFLFIYLKDGFYPYLPFKISFELKIISFLTTIVSAALTIQLYVIKNRIATNDEKENV